MKQSPTLLLDPMRVKPFADQPRKRFRGIAQLAESIRLVGQVMPIVVTPCDEDGFDAELVDGERRLQACRSGGMKVKAVFEGKVNAAERFALSIAANFCSQPHDCIEIAEAIRRLKEHGRTGEQIAGIFGKTISWVVQHYSLLGLHKNVQEMLKRAGDEKRESKAQRRRRGRMTLSVALLLTPLDPPLQLKAAQHIAKRKLSMVAARNYVRRCGEKVGKTVGKTVSPKSKMMRLWNAVDTFGHVLDPYVSMPYASLTELAKTFNAREAKVIAHRIDDLRDELAGISRAIVKASDQ